MIKLPTKGMLVENVAACNLSCLSCDRGSIRRAQGNAMMRPALMQPVIDTLRLVQPELICFFKLGEPFLSNTVDLEIDAILEASPRSKIHCSTNGMVLRGDAKVRAALRMEMIHFSIDGINTPMVRKYQVGGDFDRSYANMKALVAARNAAGQTTPRIFWKYVVFNWNDRKETIEAARGLAREAGVDKLLLFHTDSPPWGYSWRWHLYGYGKLGPNNGIGVEVAT